MKRVIKQVVQGLVAGASPFVLRAREPLLVVLMYHRVLPSDHPARTTEQPGMYVSPTTLRLHLEVLGDLFQFVHLDDWVDRVVRGAAVPPRSCAITFDDGWRDNYDYAFPVLKSKGVPATIYLVSDLVGTAYDFWPNAVARAMRELASTPRSNCPDWLLDVARSAGVAGGWETINVEHIDGVISRLKATRTDRQMRALVAELPSASEASASDPNVRRDLMNWSEVQAMSSDGLIRFGSHTRTHTRLLPSIDTMEMNREIVESMELIEGHVGYRPTSFCYPNGDYFAGALELVRGTYTSAVTTRAGWNRPSADKHQLMRVGVHEDVSGTRTSFLSRLIGVG